jgi:hypothetical protein
MTGTSSFPRFPKETGNSWTTSAQTSRSGLAWQPTPCENKAERQPDCHHAPILASSSICRFMNTSTPGSQARRSHSQPHLTVPCHPSPTNCWLLCVCPPTLLRPRSQPALCAKPGPGIPLWPTAKSPASRFRALRTRQEVRPPRTRQTRPLKRREAWFRSIAAQAFLIAGHPPSTGPPCGK